MRGDSHQGGRYCRGDPFCLFEKTQRLHVQRVLENAWGQTSLQYGEKVATSISEPLFGVNCTDPPRLAARDRNTVTSCARCISKLEALQPVQIAQWWIASLVRPAATSLAVHTASIHVRAPPQQKVRRLLRSACAQRRQTLAAVTKLQRHLSHFQCPTSSAQWVSATVVPQIVPSPRAFIKFHFSSHDRLTADR